MAEIRSRDPSPADIRRGYEGTSITIRGYVYFLIGFGASLAIIFVGRLLLYGHLVNSAGSENDERFGVPVLARPGPQSQGRPGYFPEPNLQPSPPHESIDWEDMTRLRLEQEDSLIAARWRPVGPRHPEPVGQQVRLEIPPEVIAKVGADVVKFRTGGHPPVSSGASGTMAPAPRPGAPSPAAPAEGITQPPASERIAPTQPASGPAGNGPASDKPTGESTSPAATQPGPAGQPTPSPGEGSDAKAPGGER